MQVMRNTRHDTVTLTGEIGGLLLAAPALYFPNWFPSWMLWVSLMLLASVWCWRRVRLNQWHAPTPADWPLYFLFAVMLPLAVWAAPPTLRAEYALPARSHSPLEFLSFLCGSHLQQPATGCAAHFRLGLFRRSGRARVAGPVGD